MSRSKTAASSRPVRIVDNAPAAVSARPVRTVTATIELDGYTGWTAQMQSNAPLRVLDELDRTKSGEFDIMREALVGLVISHTFPIEGDLALELTSEEVWALRRGYVRALNEAVAPSKSN